MPAGTERPDREGGRQMGDEDLPPVAAGASSEGGSGHHGQAEQRSTSDSNPKAGASGRREVYASEGGAGEDRQHSLRDDVTIETNPDTFVVHAIRTSDPLVGDLFVCPQTLEAICMQRMLGLRLTFSWERVPAPSPWEASAFSRLTWWPLAGKVTPLPAAIHPSNGVTLSGSRLVEALRKACAETQQREAALSEASYFSTTTIRGNHMQECPHNDSAEDSSFSEQPLCIGTYEGRDPTAVDRATKLAFIELVQRAVEAALQFYLWSDDATFFGFTKPMFQHSVGLIYGTYYCWSMRRSMRDVSGAQSSPRVSPEDLARPFPNPVGAACSQNICTMQEILMLDRLREALTVAEQLLEGRSFFGGAEACAVDAAVFAHLAVLFSIPLPDRRPLQELLASREALLQYCHRVQMEYNVWPAGPSFLFGVLSLSELVTGLPLRVHSWRQRSSLSDGHYDDRQDSGHARSTYQLLSWIGAAILCAALLVVAGKTPVRIGVTDGPARSRRPGELQREFSGDDIDTDNLLFFFLLARSAKTIEMGPPSSRTPHAEREHAFAGGLRQLLPPTRDAVSLVQHFSTEEPEAPVPFLLNAVCENSSIPPDTSMSPTREGNIAELQLMLSDSGLEHAAGTLWSAFYGQGGTTALPGVEEFSAQLTNLQSGDEASAEGGRPAGAHKANLFFLLHALKGYSAWPEPTGEEGDLQEILLMRLKGLARVVLGGDLLVQSSEHTQGELREVHQHEIQQEGSPAGSEKKSFQRFLMPIKGTRNPFRKQANSTSWGRRQVRPPNRRTRRVSSLRLSTHRTFCELSDRLLSALGEAVRVQVATLEKHGVPVEPGMPHAQNMMRLHVGTCLPGEGGTVQVPCLFKDSRLAQEISSLQTQEDDVVMEARHKEHGDVLKQAFTALSGLGQATTLSGAGWGLHPVPSSPKSEQGKARFLERLNLAMATMMTTTSLDSASQYWLSFERRTLSQASKTFRKNVLSILRPVGLEKLSKQLLSSPSKEVSSEDMQAVYRVISRLKELPDSMRVALALYSILPNILLTGEAEGTVLSSIEEIYGGKPLFSTRRSVRLGNIGGDIQILQSLTNIWVFAFLSESEGYPHQKDVSLRDATWVKILYSHGFTPKFVRRLFFRFTAGFLKRQREKNIRKAREELRQKLPASFFTDLFKPFTFTAHSSALMQIFNYHSMKHDEVAGDFERQLTKERPLLLRQRSAAARMDDQLRLWAAHGLDPALLESHRDFAAFKQAWEKIDLGSLPLPDLSDWWDRLNAFVVQGLRAYVDLEKHLEKQNDTVYALAHDSIRSLIVDESQTLYFTRVAHKVKGSWTSRLGSKVKRSLLSLLYRSPTRHHGVWFGVKIDFEKLHRLLDELKVIIEASDRLSFRMNAQEAFLREVQDELLVHGADVSRVPPFASRNTGMLGVRRGYATLSDEARAVEFQASSCLDHCVGLWQMALLTMLPTMLRPQMMQQYEKSFGTSWGLKKLSDPSLVNSRRMVLKSDVALNFFDYSTPKDIREELKGLESGQGAMFAYYMLFSSRAHQRLGNQYLSLLLRQQAPFMGNMVLDWIKVRQRAAISALVSSLILAFLGAYAVMGFLDILQNLTVSGATPPFDCVWNPILQEMACNPVSSGASINTAWMTALEQTFLIGLFTSSLVNFIAIRAAVVLVISGVKTLMRLQMCLGSAIMRLFRRGAKSFSRVHEYFEKRRAVKRTMLKRAVFNLKGRAAATDVDTPDAVNALESVLDKLAQGGRLVGTQAKQG
ncbi:hypothetical protein Esti_000973 [Eimeria stiedai]